MTDRIHSLTVVLSHDIREDDAQKIVEAIGMIKSVISVDTNVSDHVSYMAEQRARQEMKEKMFEILYPESYRTRKGMA